MLGTRMIPLVLAALLPVGCMMPVGHPSAGVSRSTQKVAAHSRPDAPDLKRLPNGRYRVRKPWTVNLNGRRWVVQKGYTCNGISAPDSIKKRLGDGIEHPETWAAVFHDWLFTQPGISRSTADRLFLDLMLAYGVPQEKARLMHASVSAYSLSKALR
jgi:Protein of unknown function (DUF1353)